MTSEPNNLSSSIVGTCRAYGAPLRSLRPFHKHHVPTALLFLLTFTICDSNLFAQSRSYPKEIRGYKVERTVVEIKKNKKNANSEIDDSIVDQLIQFGDPQLARVTPLGVTLEIPIVIAPVKQKGHVEFLVFEDMVVNGTSVDIDEYHRAFDLPNKQPATLSDPLRFYILLPNALLATVDDWTDSKETWPVTGRVYVFGKFKKGIFSGKRCVPVELNLTMRNPLRG